LAAALARGGTAVKSSKYHRRSGQTGREVGSTR